MDKIKINLLLKETGAFVLTYNQGFLVTKRGNILKDKEKQESFIHLLNNFKGKKRMFEFLSDAKTHLNSQGPSVGFFVEERDQNLIEVTRLYFIIGIAMFVMPMENVNYKLFFDEFIDLEGREIVVKNP